MPKRETVCVLAKGKRDAIAWARQNGYDARRVVHPLTIERIRGVVFSKIVVLPSFKGVSNRNALIKALKRIEARRYVKVKPEWIYVDVFHRDQTTVFDQLERHPFHYAPADAAIPFRLPEEAPLYDRGGELPSGTVEAVNETGEHELVVPQAPEGGEIQADEPAVQDPSSGKTAPKKRATKKAAQPTEPAVDLSDLDSIFD